MGLRRTDLALEIRERFEGDGGEISGVSLEKEEVDLAISGGKIDISTVKILNSQGAAKMGRQIGSYITIEFSRMAEMYKEDEDRLICEIYYRIRRLIKNKKERNSFLVAGLGNRQITADSLGPYVVDNLKISGHYAREFGDSFLEMINMHKVCAIAPGVMAQTGMEAEEIIESLVKKVKPDILLVVDALATSSIRRLATTVQISDTGIEPGSGVGNHRIGLNEDNLGVKVISIGVPTVVEAEIIARDRLESFIRRHGFSEKETEALLTRFDSESNIRDMYVTTKNIDESVMRMGNIISSAINKVTQR